MLLDRVLIKNFRSIGEAEISFSPTCRILVGINETGKSNVLRALSLLSSEVTPISDDVRYVGKDEEDIEEAIVSFIFRLDASELSAVVEKCSSRFISVDASTPIVQRNDTPLTIDGVAKLVNEAIHDVNLLDKTKATLYWNAREWTESAIFTPVKGWKKVVDSAPVELAVTDTRGHDHVALAGKFIFLPDCVVPPPDSLLTDVNFEQIYEPIGTTIQEHAKAHLPAVMYWTYSDSMLLPAQINMPSFAENPDSCMPLRHVFQLAGVSNIKDSIVAARSKSPQAIRNLLNRVAAQATNHIRGIWRDYKNVAISLEPNADNIDISVFDDFNRFEFSKRSDGFKRFVSFLLMVSARVRLGQLIDTLILIDEPDSGLHPSGARYLRDELIAISQRNFVVFSTHSIFMIDRENLGRHYLVSKKKEITEIEEATHSNFVNEEVVFRSLSTSTFEMLKRKNIIFEGWSDKKFFGVALSKHAGQLQAEFLAVLNEVGRCHAQGVNDVKCIYPILELADRKYLILSDGDDVAKRGQKEFSGEGKWLRYDEACLAPFAFTVEDFILPGAFRPIIDRLRTIYPGLPELNDDALSGMGKLATLEKWLKVAVEDKDIRKIKDEIKRSVLENLSAEHCSDRYLEVLNAIAPVLISYG